MKISEAVKIIEAARWADDTVLMEGLHGIGKSQIVQEFAKENDFHLVELFLSHQEVGDLIGIPTEKTIDGESVTVWSKPIWLQRIEQYAAKGIPSIVFLDELNRAPIDVRQSALQLVLERKIHEHTLPTVNGQRTMIVGAINPADEYQVDELDPALLDRFLHINVEGDAKSWLSWARNKKVNSIVRDFISEHSDRLHWQPQDGGTGATPRSWTKLADYIDNADKIPDPVMIQVIKGKVGSEIGSQFYSFYKNYVDVVKVADIEKVVEDNKDQYEKIEDIAELLSDLTEKCEAIQKSELAHQLKDKYIKKKDMLPFVAFLYSLDIEICTAFLKSMRNDDANGYKKLAAFDTEINDKNLFKRILQKANSENA